MNRSVMVYLGQSCIRTNRFGRYLLHTIRAARAKAELRIVTGALHEQTNSPKELITKQNSPVIATAAKPL